MSDEMKRFLQEELKKEADQILQEVEADLEVADLKASEEIDERLYEQIRQYKEKQDAPEEVLSEQQQEWIRLGKIYQSKRKNRKYVVLATAMMAGRDQIVLNSDDENVTEAKTSAEEEAYQKIKDEFGFDPVRILYLPEGMAFKEGTLFKEMQNAQMVYDNDKNKILRYQVVMNYKESSIGLDVEDQLLKEEKMEIETVPIEIKYYKVKNSDELHINATFDYRDIRYFLSGNNVKEEEFKKVLKNLKFF